MLNNIISWLSKLRGFKALRSQYIQMGVIKPYFDSEYYLSTYEDIAKSGIDPLKHYQQYGWREFRNPCSWFSVSEYLKVNNDIYEAGVDPFFHYLVHGWQEGRASYGPPVGVIINANQIPKYKTKNNLDDYLELKRRFKSRMRDYLT